MNVLLLGSGGREHALAWKIVQSPLLTELFIAPGNAGTGLIGKNVSIDPEDFEGVAKFVTENEIRMIVVGPEAPLVKGIYDYFAHHPKLHHIAVIGPSAKGAMLEGSKDFAKHFMLRHGIPTASHTTITLENLSQGIDLLGNMVPPYVLKADGLAAGKGVIITSDLVAARQHLKEMVQERSFGKASEKVVIEEFLSGIELSVFVLTDGKNYLLLPEAKDYKRIGEGDTGPNTGGMGSVSPVPFADASFMRKVRDQIIQPTIKGLMDENIDYKGFIFFGLINVDGNPKVIEYNCRLGDPESEVVIPRIKSDILELFDAIGSNSLSDYTIDVDTQSAATVFLVSGGYPGNFEKGKPISISPEIEDSILFHAGVKMTGEQIVTNGGRVIAITSLASTLREALEKSYKNAEKVDFEGKYYRKDLGRDLLF